VHEVEPTVEDAIALAARLRSGARIPSPEAEPYLFHALRVVLHFADPVDQTAAVLHDVVEDTDITLDKHLPSRSPLSVISISICDPSSWT
jgi:(p)ppGpp synthase/HD superfamily hydrolase